MRKKKDEFSRSEKSKLWEKVNWKIQALKQLPATTDLKKKENEKGEEENLQNSERAVLIMKEVLTTERTYLESMKYFYQVFTQGLIDHKIVSHKKNQFFLCLKPIIKLSEFICENLEAQTTDGEMTRSSRIAKTFVMSCELFGRAYFNYIVFYEVMVEFVEKAKKKRKGRVGKLCESVRERNREGGYAMAGLGVEGYMCMPIGRLPRYKLLLREYAKHSNIPSEKELTTQFMEVMDIDILPKFNQMMQPLGPDANGIERFRKYIISTLLISPPPRRFPPLLRCILDNVSIWKRNPKKRKRRSDKDKKPEKGQFCEIYVYDTAVVLLVSSSKTNKNKHEVITFDYESLQIHIFAKNDTEEEDDSVRYRLSSAACIDGSPPTTHRPALDFDCEIEASTPNVMTKFLNVISECWRRFYYLEWRPESEVHSLYDKSQRDNAVCILLCNSREESQFYVVPVELVLLILKFLMRRRIVLTSPRSAPRDEKERLALEKKLIVEECKMEEIFMDKK